MIKYFHAIGRRLFNESNFGLGLKSYKLIYKNIGLNLEHIHHKKLKIKHIKYLYKNESRFIFGKKLFSLKKLERVFLDEVNCLRSVRFSLGLPCNGQRTQTNGRTCKQRQPNHSNKRNSKRNDLNNNIRRHSRQNKRKLRIKQPKEIINKRAFGDVYKRPKETFLEVKTKQKSRIIRNIWTRNKKAKKIKKHMKSKVSRIQNRNKKKKR